MRASDSLSPRAHWALFPILLGALLLVGCSAAPAPQTTDPIHLALEQRGIDPSRVTIPFTLDESLRRWAHELAPEGYTEQEKLERLVTGLLDSGELKLEYSWGYTGTAREVADTHKANCLAFTNLFLGMAREVGVPVFFLAVETETFRKNGSFVVISDHIAVGYGEGQLIKTYDFSERVNGKLRRVRRIDDLTAIAMYHSNRGAELLQEGRLAEALGKLRMAVTLEPENAKTWVNLGVARRRAGDLEGAEYAYRVALEIDPGTYSSYQNLAALLRLDGRSDEAREMEEILRSAPHRNPFTYLSLGDLSLRRGRYDEARRLYRRAASLSPDKADSYAALGYLAAVSGDMDRAYRLLEKARRAGDENPRTLRLASMLTDDRG